MMRVGLVGVGQMGRGMGKNLLQNKFPLTVFDKFRSNAEILAPLGAKVADSVESLTQESDVIISMVQNDSQVHEVISQVLRAAPPGDKKILVDCSTVSPETSQSIYKMAQAAEFDFLDAPVSGGVNGAANGTLTLMVGSASTASFDRVKPILQAMGRPVRCGSVGAGAAVKLANNLMLAINMCSAVEGYRLAQRLGVDLSVFNEVVNSSSGQSWVTSKYNPIPGIMAGVPASREYKNGFALDLMLKDLGLALDLAEDQTEIANFCKRRYEIAKQRYGGDLDFGAINKLLDKN